jgi:uncharacterized protein YdiU (UPF0061 family)
MISTTKPVFSQRFQQLPLACFRPCAPTAIPDPYWVAINNRLAEELGLKMDNAPDHPLLALFAGNGGDQAGPALAARYAGHQFGVYVPELGDGRALLLGDLPWGAEQRAEIQLKGAGRTPFSRMGDGRAVLRSSVREYLACEAMHGLGIATTRALCLVGSDFPVQREQVETAAVLTRVAPSFIRFGSFEILAHHGQHEALQALADFVIRHHYPQCLATELPYAALFDAVCQRTAEMIAQWQAVGFCHGVMNSDNMSILGLTLDYGPFAFLDSFDLAHRCNHSDQGGRYAFNQQPRIALWNLQCLASALLPLVAENYLRQSLEQFIPCFDGHYQQRMRAKLGLQLSEEQDMALLESLLLLLDAQQTDYTVFFRRLSEDDWPGLDQLLGSVAEWHDWSLRYQARLQREQRPPAERCAAMKRVNPKIVLRNHMAESAIVAARDQHDMAEIERLARCLAQPFDDLPESEAYAGLPPDWAGALCLSCSS